MNIRTFVYSDDGLHARVSHEVSLNKGPGPLEENECQQFIEALRKRFQQKAFDNDFWSATLSSHYGQEFQSTLTRIIDLWIRLGCQDEDALCGVFARYMSVVVYG